MYRCYHLLIYNLLILFKLLLAEQRICLMPGCMSDICECDIFFFTRSYQIDDLTYVYKNGSIKEQFWGYGGLDLEYAVILKVIFPIKLLSYN